MFKVKNITIKSNQNHTHLALPPVLNNIINHLRMVNIAPRILLHVRNIIFTHPVLRRLLIVKMVHLRRNPPRGPRHTPPALKKNVNEAQQRETSENAKKLVFVLVSSRWSPIYVCSHFISFQFISVQISSFNFLQRCSSFCSGPSHRSSLIAHRSSLIAHRSSLIAHRSSLIAHRSSLTFPPSSSHQPTSPPQGSTSSELSLLPTRRFRHCTRTFFPRRPSRPCTGACSRTQTSAGCSSLL